MEIESDLAPFDRGDPFATIDGIDNKQNPLGIGGRKGDPFFQNWPGVKRGEWNDYPDGTCDCLKEHVEKYVDSNPGYEYVGLRFGCDGRSLAEPRNSNYAFKCITKKCNVKVREFAGKLYGYNSIFKRKCVDFKNDAGDCYCGEQTKECPWDTFKTTMLWNKKCDDVWKGGPGEELWGKCLPWI